MTDIDKLAREIAASVEPEPTDWTRKLIRLGLEAGMKLQRERDAGIAEDYSKRWGKRWQSGGGYNKKDEQDQHWRLAGFSDGAAVVAKAIRSAP